MPKLSVNIDHVATVREARRTWEPNLIGAAREAQSGGADGITMHLRLRPHTAMLVPEGRREITTEGGLDVVAHFDALTEIVARLRSGGIDTSLFIDASPKQVDAAARLRVAICEIHTGPFAHAFHQEGELGMHAQFELAKVADAGARVLQAGMRFNAGHALHYENVAHIAALTGLHELHIGHAIVSRSIFVGLRAAVVEMKACCTSR